eukprot:TRINITY_DN51_c0_g2_i1.p1 TRINITY_DN51_c0_g2~~TRINITY_DN51_c0_g2_i1.p1  ORF type:complete len:439 (-),score=124.70 TRINITY_DN51_c0_g2_i1:72-1364(-)
MAHQVLVRPSTATLFGTQDLADQTEAIRTLLEQKIPAECLSTRPGAGKSKFTYVESWKVIEIANSIFGFDGWSSTVVDVSPEFVDELPGGKYRVGISAVVRVMLKNGTFHEDVGFGMSENRIKGSAIENAKKEAVSDARKRALRVFGNALGNSVYDRDYVQAVQNIKSPTQKSTEPITYDAMRRKAVVLAQQAQRGVSSQPAPANLPPTPTLQHQPFTQPPPPLQRAPLPPPSQQPQQKSPQPPPKSPQPAQQSPPAPRPPQLQPAHQTSPSQLQPPQSQSQYCQQPLPGRRTPPPPPQQQQTQRYSPVSSVPPSQQHPPMQQPATVFPATLPRPLDDEFADANAALELYEHQQQQEWQRPPQQRPPPPPPQQQQQQQLPQPQQRQQPQQQDEFGSIVFDSDLLAGCDQQPRPQPPQQPQPGTATSPRLF